jgi:hypothetical protein
VYTLIPQTKVWETPLFTITAHGFNNVQIFMWLAIKRAMLIVTFSIVFVLVPRPWHHMWISFIAMNIHRFLCVLNDNYQYIDEWDVLTTAPFTIVAIVSLYFLKRKLQTRLQILHLHQDVEAALKKFTDESENRNTN